MTSAEFWGSMIRELLEAGETAKAHDITDWLDADCTDCAEMFHYPMHLAEASERPACLFHIFRDGSILNCWTGRVLTIEQAVEKVGDDLAASLLHEAYGKAMGYAVRLDGDSGKRVQ